MSVTLSLSRPWSSLPPQRRGGRVAELDVQLRGLLGKLRMAVIYAGNKQHPGSVIQAAGNTRSWKSYEPVAHDIADALRRIGVRDACVLPEDMNLAAALRDRNVQAAWLNSGGVQGYSPAAHAPAMLEMLGIPYVGHSPLSAATLDDKHAFKRHLTAVGIATPPFVTWHPADGILDPRRNQRFQRAFAGWAGSFVVKPVNGRASLNVNHVERAADLPAAAQAVHDASGNNVLVEGYVGGPEYCVAVCGPIIASGNQLRRHPGPFPFACIERVLEPGERIFTSMDVKPITAARVRHLDQPADRPVVAALHRLACAVYEEMALDTLVRLDVRADATGRLFVLEANPKPDLKARDGTVTSIIGEGLGRVGMTYDDLILSLLADRIDALLSRRRGSPDTLLARAGALQ